MKFGPVRTSTLHVKRAMKLTDALLDPEKADAARLCGIESDAVVDDGQMNRVLLVSQHDLDPRRPGVPRAVRERLLHHTIHARAVLIGKRAELSDHGQLHRGAETTAEIAGEPFQRRLQAEVVEHARAQAHCQVADRSKDRVEQPGSFADCLREGTFRTFARAVGFSELHSQRGEHLPDVIVQLASQLLALFFLSRDELLREQAHLLFGLLGLDTLTL